MSSLRRPPQEHRQFLEPARHCLCLHLRKSARAVTQRYDDALRPAGLRATQFTVLVAAAVMGPVTMTRIAETLVMDRTTLTRNLRPLQAQRLIDVRSGEDRRERTVRLTTRGRTVLETALPLWKRAQMDLHRTLGDTRIGELLRGLARTTKAAHRV